MTAAPPTGAAAIREVWGLAWPTVLTMVSYTVMQFVDAVMVAQLGPVELAAQGNGGVWSWSVIAIVVGVMGLVNTFVSQALGAERPHEVARYGWAGLWVAVLSWLLLLLPFSFVLPWLFGLMGHGERITQLEIGYASILLWGGVVVTTGKALNNFFFGIQRPRVVTVAALAGNAVNLMLNYALIFGAEGIPQLGLPGVPGAPALGVIGAAVATVAGTAVEAAIPLAIFLGPELDRRFGVRAAWRFDVAAVRDLLRLGVPASMQNVSELVTWAIFMSVLVGRFGEVALGAGWASLRYMHLSFMPAVGFSIAVTSLVGRYMGAGRPDVAAARVRTALWMAMAYMGACGVGMLVFREPMVALFANGANTDPAVAAEVVRIGASMLVAAALFQVFDAMGIVLLGALRGAGDTLWPSVVTVALSWSIIVGGGWATVVWAPTLGPLGPWLAAAAYIAIFGGLMLWRWRGGSWRAMRILETPEEEAAREAARGAARGAAHAGAAEGG